MKKYFKFVATLLIIGYVNHSVYTYSIRDQVKLTIRAFLTQQDFQGISLDPTGIAPVLFKIIGNKNQQISLIDITYNGKTFSKHYSNPEVSQNILNQMVIINGKAEEQLQAQIKISYTHRYTFLLILSTLIVFYMLKILYLSIKRSNDIEKFKITRQVAHDIRSPLSALDMIVSSSVTLPDEERRIVKHSVRRIHDIANNLLNQSKPVHNLAKSNQILLAPLVESLISEKRIQYSSFINLVIKVELTEDSLGLFVIINQSDIKRVLSNLINNSVDALKDNKGKISVRISSRNNIAIIEIVDNGSGIPENILNSLSTNSPISTKIDGNAIGFKSARETICNNNGKLEIDTIINQGTIVRIELPLSPPPEWYQRGLVVDQRTVVIIDDDKTIHQLWVKKLMQVNFIGVIQNYTDFDIEINQNAQYLIDYEFLGKDYSGLDKIIELKIPNAILVTSHYDEEEIQKKCIRHGIKIIPKSAIPYISITQSIPIDLILLDDDELIRLSWDHSAKKQNRKIACYSKSSDLMSEINNISKATPIYLDSELGEDKKGQDIALELFKLGYTNLILCTGHSPDHFKDMPWITKIQGKNYPAT